MSGRSRKAKSPKPVDSIVTVTSDGDRVRLSFHAPESVPIYRGRHPTLSVDNQTEDVNINLLGYFGNSDLDFSLQTDQLPEADLKSPPDGKRPDFLAALLATVPANAAYEEQAAQLEGLKHEVNGRIRDRVDAIIRDRLKAETADTYAQKLEITRWLNAELRRFDLSITSEKVGGAASLAADPGGKGREGRFQVKGKAKGENGKFAYFTTQSLSELLANVEIVDAHRREALAGWRGRVSEQEVDSSHAISDLDNSETEHKQSILPDIQAALIEEMRRQPHDSYADKKALSVLINGQLRKHGFAIRCPKTGRPSSLGADPGNHPDEGRFHIVNQNEEGKRVRTFLTPNISNLLANFELMVDDPERKRWGKWTEQSRHSGNGRTPEA